jgi:hypothetical protein
MLDRISDVKSIHAKAGSAYILTNSGDVWAFGENNQGRLGDETTLSRWSNIVQVSIENVKDVKPTLNGAFFLLNNNQVFASGTESGYSTPHKLYDNVLFMTNAYQAVNIVTENTVYEWQGLLIRTYSRELGSVPYYAQHYWSPNRQFYIKDGSLFARGNQDDGELGLGTESISYNNFVRIENLSNVEKIFTFSDNTFVQTSNGFFGFGKNNSNQLITYDNIDRFKPYPIVFGLKGNFDELSFESNLNLIINYDLFIDNWIGTNVEVVSDIKKTVVSYTNIQDWTARIEFDLSSIDFTKSLELNYKLHQNHQYYLYISTNQGDFRHRWLGGDRTVIDLKDFENIHASGSMKLVIQMLPNNSTTSGIFEISNITLSNSSIITHEFYGESIILDFNESIVSSSAYGNISLQNTETGGLVAIRRSILLDKLTITPTRALEVGTVYQLVIPTGALSSKFMVSNERYVARFEYLGTYDPSLLPVNQQAFLEEAKKIETVSTIINNVNVQYVNETYRLTMNVIDASLPSGVFNLLETLGVYEVSFDSGKTYITLDYLNVSTFIDVIRNAILTSSNSRITLNYKAKIALDGFDPFTADFTAIFNFDSNTSVYNDLVDIALNMEMRLLELSHEEGSSRHLSTKAITLTFNNAKASDRFDDIVLKDQNNDIVPSLISLEDNVLTIEAFMPLTNGSTYTYDIPNGALVDDLGNFNQRYLHTFKVYEPIKLIRSSISTGDENIALNQEFRLFYNFAIANNLSLITLKDSNNNNVAITRSLVNHVLYIKPVSELLHSETYTLSIPNGVLKDELNVLSQAISYTFDTIEKETRFFYTSAYIYELFQTFVC